MDRNDLPHPLRFSRRRREKNSVSITDVPPASASVSPHSSSSSVSPYVRDAISDRLTSSSRRAHTPGDHRKEGSVSPYASPPQNPQQFESHAPQTPQTPSPSRRLRSSPAHLDIRKERTLPTRQNVGLQAPSSATIKTKIPSESAHRPDWRTNDTEAVVARLKLVVGLDFGTTYSGAAYALAHPGDDPKDVKITTISGWAGELPGDTDSQKVPTQIAYPTEDNAQPHWGFDIPESLQESTLRWFKPLLEPEYIEKSTMPSPIINTMWTRRQLADRGMNAVDVASDYVRLLWTHVRQQIINQHDQATFDQAHKSIILTVPAVWSHAAKHNTYLVAVNAGLAHEDYELRLVAESEAAAVAVLKDRDRQVEKGDIYTIVDAGGGTVDLTTYLVKSVKPLVLEEQIPGNGDLCGAAFLSFNFRELLRDYLGHETMSRLVEEEPETEARIIKDFEDGIRKRFDGTDQRRMNVAVPGVPDNVERKIRSGIMRFTAADLMPVFLPVLAKVEALVQQQVLALQAQGKTPDAILLVGGFGTNQYLFKRLRGIYSDKDSPMHSGRLITVSQPRSGWQAVADGAVLCDLLDLGSLFPLRIARYNIGLVADRDWDAARDPPELAIQVPHFDEPQVRLAKWFLRRGDHIRTGKTIDFDLTWIFLADRLDQKLGTGQRHFRLVSSADEKPSRYADDVRVFAHVTMPLDLSEVPPEEMPPMDGRAGELYRSLRSMVHVTINAGGVGLACRVLGKIVGNIEHVKFHGLEENK